jgi:hypothetical protein
MQIELRKSTRGVAYQHELRANNATPVPYQEGDSLQLQVRKNCCNMPFSQSITAVICRRLTITMSPVMEVTVATQSGSKIRAILKLYDRRFGSGLRKILGKHAPHTSADEAAFRHFVRQGQITPSLEKLQEEKRTNVIRPQPYYVLGDAPYIPEDKAKFEAALWQECDDHFDCETEVYPGWKISKASQSHDYTPMCVLSHETWTCLANYYSHKWHVISTSTAFSSNSPLGTIYRTSPPRRSPRKIGANGQR